MSKFQSFASQGSFRDYQLQAPDEAAKIKEETQRTIRGKERAEQFRQGNADLYLRAQKLAQQQEEMSRETNFKLETESRRLYKQSLDRDFQIQTQNDRTLAAQQQQTFKDLSAFSQTAAKMFVNFNTKITENQTNANTVNTIIAGTTFEQNLAIQGMVDNLTEAEFAQQNFIQQMVKEGKDVKALWTLYNNRNTRGFIENAGVIQNTSYSLAPYLSEVLKNLDPTLTPDQKRLQVETAYREWIANSFKDANGKQLNPKLVSNIGAPIFGKAYTQLMGEFDKEERKVNQENWKDSRSKTLDLALLNGGSDAVMQQSKTKEQRASTTDWALTRLKAGTMSWQEAEALLTQPIIDENGKQTNWVTKHPSDPNIGRLREGIKEARRGLIQQDNLIKTERRQQLDTDLINYYNEVGADGSISREDRLGAERIINEAGLPDYESPVFNKFFVEQEDSVRYDEAAKTILDKEAAAGNLKVERIQAMKGISAQLKQQYLNLAVQQQRQRETPAYKTDVAAIKAAVSQDPRVKAAPVTGKENYSVLLMQDRFVRQYKETLQRTGSNDEARAVTLAAIQTLLANPKSITAQGLYADVVQQEAQFATKGKDTLENYKEFVNVLSDPDVRNNPTKLANTLGAATVYSAYDDMQAGKPASAIIKNGAALMGMAPIDFVNYLASGANDPNMKPITLDTQAEEIRKNMKPITRRLYNVNRTNERIIRGSIIDHNGLSSAPRRASFGPSQSSNLADPVLRRAADITSNYESAGSGGYNAVNQGGSADGTSVPAGFYSGDFRAMPQHKGRSLTDLTVGEIMSLQADPGGSAMSDAEWVERGKLHAVGRYQFIGTTLKGLVQRLNIPLNAKFSPELQDRLFLSLLKSGGPGQWIGLRNATAQELAIIRQAQSKL